MAHLGLVVELDHQSGWWRPTVLGVRFVNAEVRVPVAVYLYNSEVRPEFGVNGFDPRMVSIQDVLDVGYAEAMDISAPEAEDRLMRVGHHPQMDLFSGTRP
jgi:hypothetical protein